MAQPERIRLRRDFLAANQGRRVPTAGFVLLVRQREDGNAAMRAGFTVTKKVGNSVVRNRLKRRLREIDRRVRFIQRRLHRAEVVDPRDQKRRDQVFFGATVTYAREDDSEVTVMIVGMEEAVAELGRISWVSPSAVNWRTRTWPSPCFSLNVAPTVS